eukprot:11187908-Lingulodinium_polyedra.AAC.1
MMRSRRPSAAAAVSASHVSRNPCERQFGCLHGVCEACDLRALVAAEGRLDRAIVHVLQNRAQ